MVTRHCGLRLDHVAILLDALIGFDADAVGEAALASVRERLKDDPGRFRVGVVVADDAHGGWTNRYASEFSYRFEEAALYKMRVRRRGVAS